MSMPKVSTLILKYSLVPSDIVPLAAVVKPASVNMSIAKLNSPLPVGQKYILV